ncbi:hypothetical protein OROMI_019782 [Orobanche minor]
MMRKPYSDAAVGDDGRIPFVRLYRQNPDGSFNQYLRGMSLPLFLKNSRIINLPSFKGLGMGGGCGGLFYLDDCEGKQAVIINPVLTQFKFLPPSDVQRPPNSSHFRCSACGFGFDSLSDDYKVIRFVEIRGETRYGGILPLGSQIEIYSLKTNRWKEIPIPNLLLHTLVCGSGLYVNGKCYWIVCGDLRASSLDFVLSFDFEKESFSFISLPKVKEEKMMDLHEYKGSLAVVGYELSGLNRSFEAWILVKEEEQQQVMWEKLFDVKAPSSVCRTLGFGNNGGVLFIEGKVKFGDKSGTMLLECDVMSGDLKQHPMVNQRGIMQIFSYSFGKTVWLPDAEFAIPTNFSCPPGKVWLPDPIKKEGTQGIEIFPPTVESTSAKQIHEDKDEDESIRNRVEDMSLGDEGMEFSSCIETAA